MSARLDGEARKTRRRDSAFWQRPILAAFLIWSCNSGARDADSNRDVPALRDLKTIGAFTEPDLVEASGVVASTRVPGVFWSQNDSGNDERVFAYDSTGRAIGAVRIAGSDNRDWEAIAIGPCPTGSCLYIGDVGDNGARRDSVRVWRVPEPLPTDTVSPIAERLYLRYTDGPRDVEAIYVAPDTSLFLISKRPDLDATRIPRPARLYHIAAGAWRESATVVAAIVDSLPVTPTPRDARTWVTDASLSEPDSTGARRLAVRTYLDVFVFAMDSLTWQPSTLIAHCSLRDLKTLDGEGVTWLPDGRLLFNSEGSAARLKVGRCP